MELRQIGATLWKRWWLIALATVIAAVSSWLVVKDQPDTYQTSTTLMIGQTIQQVAPDYSEFYTSEWLAQTYSELVRREPILKATASALGFEDQWPRLRGQLSVSLVPGTQLMEIRVTDTEPERAKLIADEIARQLMTTVEKSRPRDSYRQFVQDQVGTLPPKIETAQGEIAALEAELGQAFGARQIQDIQNRIGALEKQVSDWQATFAQYQLLLGETGVNVLTVIEEAPVPVQPIGPQWLMQVVLAAAIGMMLAVAAAFLLEYLDETLRSGEDLEKATGLTILGIISRIPGSGTSDMLVTSLEPKSHISEAYRTLRTNLRFSSPDRPLHKMMITSPGALEGKSTMTSNLAVVMAQDGKAVVLVDADLRRPRQHKIFGLENQEGLSDLLVDGERHLDGRLQDTGIENLRLLPSGPQPPNPSELLGSQSMARLIERLEDMADIVLFDMAPVLPVTDAAVLAPQVDGVLLIAEAGRTRRGAARRAVENLRRVGANLLGTALNRVKIGGRSGYYYNYYYYAADEEGRPRKRRRRS